MEIREQIKERFLKHIGSVIKTYRNRQGIERHVLASALGCDDSTLSRYEHGTSDIKASTMAYISVLCNFPMSKYTDIYNKEPAAIVEDFRKLVAISRPVKRRKRINMSNRPPKPKLEFNESSWKWEINENPVVYETSHAFTANTLEYTEIYDLSDDFFTEYMMHEDNKRALLSHVSDIVNTTACDYSDCPRELKSLAKSVLKYIVSESDRTMKARLVAYQHQIENSCYNHE